MSCLLSYLPQHRVKKGDFSRRRRIAPSFCGTDSHYVSQFSAFYIVTRTEISTVKSCIWLLGLLT